MKLRITDTLTVRRCMTSRFLSLASSSMSALSRITSALIMDLRATVETLPTEWAADLYQAVIALDDDQMLAIIESVRPQAPQLSDTLAGWVRDLAYERLMTLVAPEA